MSIKESQIQSQILKLRKTVLYHPCFKEAYDCIESAYAASLHTNIPQYLLCVGHSGTGKSTLMQLVTKKHSPKALEEKVIRPVLSVEIPSAPTIKNVAEAVLVALGDPCFARGSAIEKTQRIIHLAKEMEVNLIIFDEMQHFFDQGNKRSPYEVSDWLKTLNNKINASVVLMGLHRTEHILDLNEQLRRRFCRRLELTPFSIDTPSEASNFAIMVENLASTLGILGDSNLRSNPDLLQRIYFATNGITDYIAKLLIGALIQECETSSKALSNQTLEPVFTKWIWHKGVGNMNPFNSKFSWGKLNQPGMPFYIAGRQIQGLEALFIRERNFNDFIYLTPSSVVTNIERG